MVLDNIHNVTGLEGTWSTGSQRVLTGPTFVSPNNRTFFPPKTSGISISFTYSGFYESSQYRLLGNGTDPHCLTATLMWDHGSYVILGNGSIITTPFGDGFQQVQAPCEAVSNFIQAYNFTTLYRSFRIFQDLSDGPKLSLANFDDSPNPPFFQVSSTPTMFPTRSLVNTTSTSSNQAKRELKERSSGAKTWTSVGAGALVASLVTAGAASALL
ncbi:chaperone for protein-folding within the ER, fungal-domain-containing protein [Irpex rosettiformis]|uniref:Chaperone for protein-folding within the ER, fungal-domain-containing protein n=1 Tax=Irpex rosettiformis TaxID=378272 RepID=A0ACB8U3S7_9APHY|nr:chaperone for protein-folding within the ER, fungal-domain-containing protein [Irpex rosettiformis]